MDLETLYTSHDGFRIETATFLQRAKLRIIDGIPLDDLLERATEFERRTLEAAIGCDPSQLPTGTPPVEVGDFAPVRTGKSVEFAALAVARARTVDVSIIKPGEEPPRISILATQIDQAQAVRGHLNVLLERKSLKKFVLGHTDDSVTVRHPSGLPIEIRVIAASRGGYSLASRFAATVIFDEAPGWNSTDKIVSLEDSADQALSRLLTGAQIIYGGSVWQPSGKCFDLDKAHFGRPSSDVVVIRPRAVDNVTPAEQLNPVYWTPERVARMRKARGFRMHVMNEFGGATSVFDYDAIESAFRRPRCARIASRPFGVIDASSGKKDTWSFAVAQWIVPEPPESSYLRVPDPGLPEGLLVTDNHGRPITRPDARDAKPYLYFPVIDGFEGEFWSQISAEEVVARVADVFARAGVRHVHGDQREAYMLEAAFRRHGFIFHEHPYTAGSKADGVERVRRWLATGTLVLPQHEKLRRELHAFVEKPTPGGGFTFGARGSGHDDYVALMLTSALADISGELNRSPIVHDRSRNFVPENLL